jgi:hypothetical protein
MRKKFLVALIVVLMVFIGFTGVEWYTEPPAFHSSPKLTAYYITMMDNRTFNPYPTALDIHTFYNFSFDGNHISLGYAFYPDGGATVENYSGGNINDASVFFIVQVWIASKTLSFPYTGISLIPYAASMETNGTFLKNVVQTPSTNILPYMSKQSYDNHTTTFGFQWGVGPGQPWDNLTDYMNAGTYAFNFTFSILPVFEIGPYHMNGPIQTIRDQWVQTYLL